MAVLVKRSVRSEIDLAKTDIQFRSSFKKIQDWVLKSERIRNLILRFFCKYISPRSQGSWCIKETEESVAQSGFFGSNIDKNIVFISKHGKGDVHVFSIRIQNLCQNNWNICRCNSVVKSAVFYLTLFGSTSFYVTRDR